MLTRVLSFLTAELYMYIPDVEAWHNNQNIVYLYVLLLVLLMTFLFYFLQRRNHLESFLLLFIYSKFFFKQVTST